MKEKLLKYGPAVFIAFVFIQSLFFSFPDLMKLTIFFLFLLCGQV